MRQRITAAIEARRFSLPMKRALRRLLDGEPYRQAATAEGVGFRDLHRNAGTVDGLKTAHLQAWQDGWGAAFPSVWRQHVEHLDEAE